MFILEGGLGPVLNTKLAKKIGADSESKDKKPQNTFPLQEEDSFKQADTSSQNEQKPAPPFLKEKLTPPAPNGEASVTFVKGRKFLVGDRAKCFCNEIAEDNEELAEILKAQLARDNEARELERIYTLLSFSASNPLGVLSALKNLKLTTAFAISLAANSIAEIAPFAMKYAIKEAKEKGDTSFAKAIAHVLGTATSNACSECPFDAGEHLGGVQNMLAPLFIQEICAVDEKGNVVGIFYEYSDEEECAEVCNARQFSNNVNLEEFQESKLALNKAEAGKKRGNDKKVVIAKDSLKKTLGLA